MAKILSQEEIDALLNSVSTGQENGFKPGEKRRRVALYDFKRPNLISKEQLRLLEHIHEALARNFSVFLSAQLRLMVDMNLLAVDQIMYSEFVMSISAPGAIFIGNIDSPASQIVLEFSPQLAIFIVERLFGGKGSFVSKVRPISLIEQRIVKRVVDRVGAEIRKNWKPIREFNCTFNRFENNPEFVQIVPASEPVVVVTLELKIHGNTSLFNICYPYLWISSVMSRPELQEKLLLGTPELTEGEKQLVSSNLDNTTVPVKAVLGSSKVSVRDILNMKEGDVLRLDATIGSKRPVFVHNRHLYSATIGKRGKNYAFCINSLISGEEHEVV